MLIYKKRRIVNYMKDGKLIVIEGSGDSTGKTTQYIKLKDRLLNEGYPVVLHHFPSYGTYHGLLVEKFLNGDFGECASDISPYFANSLYAIDRAIYYLKVLGPAYDNGDLILLDRYTTSSLIYQGAVISNEDDKKRFFDWTMDFEYNKLGIKEPDEVFFLHMPFEYQRKLWLNRKTNDGIFKDILESDTIYMRQVYENSVILAKYLNWNIIECIDGENIRSVDDIHQEIYSKVKKKIK